MALFHFTVDQMKRSEGQSAIASAAYRSGERLYSEYYGEYSDYTRKGGVICSDILSYRPTLPQNLQTARPCGMPLNWWNGERKLSLHTALKLPCRTSLPLRKISLWQGSFCWTTL